MNTVERPAENFIPDAALTPPPVFSSTRYAPTASHLEVACDKLRRAATSLDFPMDDQERMCALLQELCASWGNQPVGMPRFWSNASVEGNPFELSFAWEGHGPEIRIGFETLGEPPTMLSNLDACRLVTRRLTAYPGVSIANILAVEEIFSSPHPTGMFSMGHAIAWRVGAIPLIKVYLNPQFHGPERAQAQMDEAMARLGVSQSWHAVRQHLAAVGAPVPYAAGVSLDLADPKVSRTKVYLRHTDVDAASIDLQAEIAGNHVAGTFEQALHRVTGHFTPGWKKPPVTCFTLHPGLDVPFSATLFVPLIPDLDNDAVIRDRVCQFMQDEGVDPSPYASVLEAITDRPLSQSKTHNFVSYKAQPDQPPRFAVYIAPGVYA